MMRATFLLSSLLVLMMFTNMSGAHGEDSEEEVEHGRLVDVVIVDLNCEENTTCVERPSNIVEYFGADWCEPCKPVEDQLRNRTEDSVFVMSHRPSSSDSFHLQSSRLRHMEIYRQYGYPYLVIGGSQVLSSKTQALDLENVLSNFTGNFSGINTVVLNGSNLSIEGDLDNRTIDVWTVSDRDGKVNMATSHSNLSENSTVDLDGDYLVVMLSDPGVIDLEPASTLQAGGYLPDGHTDLSDEIHPPTDGLTIVIITVLLLMITLPATYQLFQVMRQPIPLEEE